MNPYKHIEEGKKVIKTLANEARTMDNTVTRLKELNILITMVNSFEEMLKEKYYTDFFELLILSRMYHTLIKSEEINIEEFLIWFEKDLRTGKDYIKENIAGYLQGVQISNSLKKGHVYQDNKEDWLKVIDNTLNQIKTKIKWKNYVDGIKRK